MHKSLQQHGAFYHQVQTTVFIKRNR
ncbi:hypothetical protein QR98_0006690 [Sarcoptes scabiei]|uniref:Uncharacterized protein n=1 Tax=Sarcoptes scabiei TaxID=52283 RepID=A0A131ZVX2_SARSC|nr:hypothetical protein QR98_0006690 [Sarcoptes scabiei]